MTIAAIRPKKIAVVGSGISGLSCAWLLDRAHDVTLYEKDDRLGGHANTVSFPLDEHRVDVDTGFIVFNPVNYPNLVELFRHLGVTTCNTDMSFGFSRDQGKLEYSGSSLRSLLAQKSNLLRPRFWNMLRDLLAFYRNAERFSQALEQQDMSLGELLRKHGYSDAFIHDHLLPMGAAIWSTPTHKMLDYPASSFMRFCLNHGLVQLSDRPQWQTVVGGSHHYVEKIRQSLKGRVHLNSLIHRIRRSHNQVWVEDLHGRSECYDHIVLACHPDQALKLLAEPSQSESGLLSCFPYQRNQAFLHLDEALMPRRRQTWSSWNYICSGQGDRQQVSVTYWMNRLQPLACEQPVFVSLNPIEPPRANSLIRTFFYDHPAFDGRSMQAQKQLWRLQGQQNTWFCGAYFGYGFHEDGLQSGLAVAEQLGGIPRPWSLANPNSRIHVTEPASAEDPIPEVQHA